MKLYELQKWTKVKLNDDILADEKERIVEFMYVDGMYWLWKHWKVGLIMWLANQDVEVYWEILDDSKKS
jgi:hypothetical protein